jgi:hypothetical protein
VYFHSCDPPENANKVMLEFPEGGLLRQLRKAAFHSWIEELNKKQPEKVLEGIPAGWHRIDLVGKHAKNMDLRLQKELLKATDIPKGINRTRFKQYAAWMTMNVINGNGLADCFSEHASGREKGHPLHLFINGCVLVIGGVQLDEYGKVAKEGTPLVHQAHHIDVKCEEFESADKCPLLSGLGNPCAFNTALADYREINVEDYILQERTHRNPMVAMRFTALKNDVLILHCDATHSGCSYIWDGSWHPSLHMVVQSSRYRQKPWDAVLDIRPSLHVPTEQLSLVSKEGFTEWLKKLKVDIRNVVKIQDKHKFKLGKSEKEFVGKLKESFCETEETERKGEKKNERKSTEKEKSGKKRMTK